MGFDTSYPVVSANHALGNRPLFVALGLVFVCSLFLRLGSGYRFCLVVHHSYEDTS